MSPISISSTSKTVLSVIGQSAVFQLNISQTRGVEVEALKMKRQDQEDDGMEEKKDDGLFEEGGLDDEDGPIFGDDQKEEPRQIQQEIVVGQNITCIRPTKFHFGGNFSDYIKEKAGDESFSRMQQGVNAIIIQIHDNGLVEIETYADESFAVEAETFFRHFVVREQVDLFVFDRMAMDEQKLDDSDMIPAIMYEGRDDDRTRTHILFNLDRHIKFGNKDREINGNRQQGMNINQGLLEYKFRQCGLPRFDRGGFLERVVPMITKRSFQTDREINGNFYQRKNHNQVQDLLECRIRQCGLPRRDCRGFLERVVPVHVGMSVRVIKQCQGHLFSHGKRSFAYRMNGSVQNKLTQIPADVEGTIIEILRNGNVKIRFHDNTHQNKICNLQEFHTYFTSS